MRGSDFPTPPSPFETRSIEQRSESLVPPPPLPSPPPSPPPPKLDQPKDGMSDEIPPVALPKSTEVAPVKMRPPVVLRRSTYRGQRDSTPVHASHHFGDPSRPVSLRITDTVRESGEHSRPKMENIKRLSVKHINDDERIQSLPESLQDHRVRRLTMKPPSIDERDSRISTECGMFDPSKRPCSAIMIINEAFTFLDDLLIADSTG